MLFRSAAAMETAPASQGGSPGTPPPRHRPRPPHGPLPTDAAAAAAAAILARPGRPLPGGTCAPLPRSRRPRGCAARAAGCGRRSPGCAARSGAWNPEGGPGRHWRARTGSGASSCVKWHNNSTCLIGLLPGSKCMVLRKCKIIIHSIKWHCF